MNLSQNKDRKGVPGETVMKIRIPINAGNTLLSWTTLVSQVKLCSLYLVFGEPNCKACRFVACDAGYRSSEFYDVWVKLSDFTKMSPTSTIKYGNLCQNITSVFPEWQILYFVTGVTITAARYLYIFCLTPEMWHHSFITVDTKCYILVHIV